MWRLNEEKIQGKSLFIHLKISNTILNTQLFSYNKLKLILYYMDNEIGDANTVIYNGEHGKLYGLFMTGDVNPAGASYDLETLKINMMDGELPIRFNIQSKELEVDFTVDGDTLEDSQRKLRAIRSWFANVRNSMTIPTYNSLIFTYDPNLEYFVIFKDVIEVEKEITSLHCTAKFYVPAGVAMAVNPLRSGPVGRNPGEIRVWPLIEIKANGSDSIVLTDTKTGLTITLNESITANTQLFFDCANRTVTDSAGNDYTTSLGLNTAWINFMGKADYNITLTGGILQQLTFKPGF
jgi:predicted phage tail component-like protein